MVQNWIGPAGSNLHSATFVTPPPEKVPELLADLEAFIVAEDRSPPLIKIGLVHAQFETIHPFIDGNGWMGRLFITFYLCQRGILARPLLYLSIYLKQHLENFIIWGPDDKKRQVWDQGVNLADHFEMLIGVIYLEKGIGVVRVFLEKHNFFIAIDAWGKTS